MKPEGGTTSIPFALSASKYKTSAREEPQTLTILEIKGALGMKHFLTHFKDEIQSALIENCSTEIKILYLLPSNHG